MTANPEKKKSSQVEEVKRVTAKPEKKKSSQVKEAKRMTENL